MIQGQCHCGTVRFELPAPPERLVACNCSICRRFAALWAHSEGGIAKVDAPADGTIRYVWGDCGIAFHSCATCGCTTHWTGTDGDPDGRMAVNMRMCAPDDLQGLTVRHFDGADSWTFID